MKRLRTYAQLVRLPNVFSALADIGLGALATHALPSQWAVVACLCGASVCLYWAGMVWNDYFDLEKDRRERPSRPLPSGRVAKATAGWLGVGLAVAGLGCAWGADLLRATPARWSAFALACSLLLAVLLYDGWLKKTWLGPLAMGLCRLLNVLLGLSASEQPFASMGLPMHLASVVGIYIVGVTWFARTEAVQSRRASLQGASLVMLLSLLLALPLPARAQEWPQAELVRTSALFPYLLVALGFYVGLPVCLAFADPQPKKVQQAVKRALLGLVGLDAVLATGLAGEVGLVLLLLLLPALYLGRWLYST